MKYLSKLFLLSTLRTSFPGPGPLYKQGPPKIGSTDPTRISCKSGPSHLTQPRCRRKTQGDCWSPHTECAMQQACCPAEQRHQSPWAHCPDAPVSQEHPASLRLPHPEERSFGVLQDFTEGPFLLWSGFVLPGWGSCWRTSPVRTVNLCWEAALGQVWGKASTPGFSCRFLESLVNGGCCVLSPAPGMAAESGE